MAEHTRTDCRTTEGVTVGLIDSIITAARALVGRDFNTPVITAALADLRTDRDIAELLAGGPMPSTSELLDAAAERGHDAMFEGGLAESGIERDLWHQVALAVLDDPQLLPHWARAARVDADNWHRQCNELDAELEGWRSTARSGTRAGWVLSRVREALGTPNGRAVSVHAAEVRKERDTWEAEYERVRDLKLTDLADALAERDGLQARLDDVLAWLEDADGMELTRVGIDALRAKLQSDQPARVSRDAEVLGVCRDAVERRWTVEQLAERIRAVYDPALAEQLRHRARTAEAAGFGEPDPTPDDGHITDTDHQEPSDA